MTPELHKQKVILDYWDELHYYTIHEAPASAIHRFGNLFSYSEYFAFFKVAYRPESEGNPAAAFEVQHASLIPFPPLGTPYGEMLRLWREGLKGLNKYVEASPSRHLGCYCEQTSHLGPEQAKYFYHDRRIR